jgi:hypothetical protein
MNQGRAGVIVRTISTFPFPPSGIKLRAQLTLQGTHFWWDLQKNKRIQPAACARVPRVHLKAFAKPQFFFLIYVPKYYASKPPYTQKIHQQGLP